MAKKKPTRIVSLGKATTKKEATDDAPITSKSKAVLREEGEEWRFNEVARRLGLTPDQVNGYLSYTYGYKAGPVKRMSTAEKLTLLEEQFDAGTSFVSSPKRSANDHPLDFALEYAYAFATAADKASRIGWMDVYAAVGEQFDDEQLKKAQWRFFNAFKTNTARRDYIRGMVERYCERNEKPKPELKKGRRR